MWLVIGLCVLAGDAAEAAARSASGVRGDGRSEGVTVPSQHVDVRIDSSSLLQTRLEMAADLEDEVAPPSTPGAAEQSQLTTRPPADKASAGHSDAHAPPPASPPHAAAAVAAPKPGTAARAPHVGGGNGTAATVPGVSLRQRDRSRRPRDEFKFQGRLDSKAVPFGSVAGLSDDLDVLEEVRDVQKERHHHVSERAKERERLAQLNVQTTTPPKSERAVEVYPEVPRMALTDYKSYRQAMVNFGDVQYISYITIGRQTISGILDTGSFELVVFSAVCQSCGQAAKYDAALSTSYTAGKLASGQSYGSGDTTSLEAFDNVAIGPFDEANQTFWEVFDAHMPILHHAAFQSIIGVGPPETPAADAWANARKASDNLTEFYAKGKRAPIDARQRLSNKITIAKEMSSKSTMLNTFKVQMFSVCVGARPGSDGYFIWNDTSPVDMPDIFHQVPVVGKHTWSVQLRSVRLDRIGGDNQALTTTGPPQDPLALGCYEDSCGALVDSGTSLLAVPTAVINKLLQYLENMGANCSKLSSLPDLVFEMNGMQFSLPPDSYVAEVKGAMPNYLQSFVRVRNLARQTGQCQIIVMESFADSMFGPLWILGVPFFRKYYTTFNVGTTKSDRSIFVASASEDCEPVPRHTADIGLPYKRCIDPAKLYVPATVMAAATEEFVHL